MRVTVIGGGVVGLLTAVECVLAGHRVTLIEQGRLPNARAASADRHRIMRALHPGDEAATTAAAVSHRRWIELERLLYTRFYDRVGALTVNAAGELADSVSMLSDAGIASRVLDTDALATRYPQFAFGPDKAALLERDTGVLLADRVLTAGLGWLRWQADTSLMAYSTVVGIDADAGAVRLADGTDVHGDAVVVAAGAWSRALLPAELSTQVTLYRQSMVYCAPRGGDTGWRRLPAMPVLGDGRWLVPPVAGTPLKISSNSACRRVDDLTDAGTAERWLAHLVAVFTPLIRGFDRDWVVDARDCYYLADAAGGGPVLVQLGGSVVGYAACGGISFKFAPLIARTLMRRATGSVVEPTGLAALDRVRGMAAAGAETSPSRGVHP